MSAEIGFELPTYEEYLSDHCLQDTDNNLQQYNEYLEELRSEYENND